VRGITGSARLKIGSTADKWRDNSERGRKKEERGMALLSHRNILPELFKILSICENPTSNMPVYHASAIQNKF
jgi:hypothetical protein